jgi:hypothetical protein
MSGNGASSGRGGRERQGEAQQRIDTNEQNNGANFDSDSSTGAGNPPQSRPNAARSNSYSLWTEPKKTCVLQALIDTPRRMMQNPSMDSDKNFERNNNRSGESKESIDKLEYVMFPICVHAANNLFLHLWRNGQSYRKCMRVSEW